MSKAEQVAATVDNRKANAERLRIHWRAWVLSQPGGVDFLCALVRKRMREQDMGPHKLAFPPTAQGATP